MGSQDFSSVLLVVSVAVGERSQGLIGAPNVACHDPCSRLGSDRYFSFSFSIKGIIYLFLWYILGLTLTCTFKK